MRPHTQYRQRRKLLHVYEHQRLQVGEEMNGIVFTQKHLDLLTRFALERGEQYYRLFHQGVRFLNYVGVMQVGDLCIEILPKADRQKRPDAATWQQVLLDMLRECRLIKPRSEGSSGLQLRAHAILDLYYDLFLEEVEQLLRAGLLKRYIRRPGNLKVWRGRILFKQQLRNQLAHKEQFYTIHDHYSHDHLLNAILAKALQVLEKLILPSNLRIRLHQLLARFPTTSSLVIREEDFERIRLDRNAERYDHALNMARLLICNFSPDIRAGNQHLLALMFDMNLLFEEYTYRMLLKAVIPRLKVGRQIKKPFWNRRFIRPDILLTYQGESIVLDTKWKILEKASPSIEDLKQMYIYNKYFNTKKAVLLYPQVGNLKDMPPTPFNPTDGASDKDTHSCQICFFDIHKDGMLNREAGKDLLAKLLQPGVTL